MYKWGGPRTYPAFVLFCLNKKARFAVVAGVAPPDFITQKTADVVLF